ncbi:hypothetical protein FNW02_15935 [Komarekiella sp. 'clone 1']|uniref:Uncharacterized protein n=1 Tax=Komarekiella delphini-convector SJRDD-AB1 TaxID=2593771 RepID=A0AA40SXS5_9NOST|nr:hypothetical protein [Komarekiella delphini-convector SJRDD-AB1]
MSLNCKELNCQRRVNSVAVASYHTPAEKQAVASRRERLAALSSNEQNFSQGDACRAIGRTEFPDSKQVAFL